MSISKSYEDQCKEVWLAAWTSTAQSSSCVHPTTPRAYADQCLQEFKVRFSSQSKIDPNETEVIRKCIDYLENWDTVDHKFVLVTGQIKLIPTNNIINEDGATAVRLNKAQFISFIEILKVASFCIGKLL